MNFAEIEAERKRRNIPVERLAGAAGISVRSYQRIRAGERQPRQDTIARLAAGLAAAKRPGDKRTPTKMLFRLVLAQLAMTSDMDLAQVMAHDPQRKATADPTWMEISRLRNLTCYMLNTVIGISNAEVARAAGVSAPAITIALAKMEVKRDDPALGAVFDMLDMAVSG